MFNVIIIICIIDINTNNYIVLKYVSQLKIKRIRY